MTARALILPSFAEGLPVVIMEAMALRCPVLTTRIAGIPELVIDGETGWLMNPGDIQQIISAIDDLAHTDDDRIDRITAAAAGRVRQRHSAATEAAKLLGVLNGDPPRIPSSAPPHFAAS
jgi:glycosyltransferase involved in cell wall biosynthesis